MGKFPNFVPVNVFCQIDNKSYTANLNEALDLSLSFGPEGDNPNAFGIPPAFIGPIKVGDFVGSVEAGSGANCDTILFCAHGNGTHTECIGHITKEHHSVNQYIKRHFFTAQLITLPLKPASDDLVIHVDDLKNIRLENTEAIIIRTMPNTEGKKDKIWSGNNPPYFDKNAMQFLRDKGYQHLLTDLPSVDREEDDGVLAAHHVWWHYPENPRWGASITELIYAPDEIADGLYLLNLQFAAVESDASPSRPLIFALKQA